MATKTALNVAGTGSDGKAGNKNGTKRGWGGVGEQGNKNGPKRGRDGVRRQSREQKQPAMWRGRGRKAGPGTKTAPNVAGAMSERRASDIP